MKRFALAFVAMVIILSTLALFCSIAKARYLAGLLDDFYDPPNGRIFLEGGPPYPYIPTEPIKEPPIPIVPT